MGLQRLELLLCVWSPFWFRVFLHTVHLERQLRGFGNKAPVVAHESQELLQLLPCLGNGPVHNLLHVPGNHPDPLLRDQVTQVLNFRLEHPALGQFELHPKLAVDLQHPPQLGQVVLDRPAEHNDIVQVGQRVLGRQGAQGNLHQAGVAGPRVAQSERHTHKLILPERGDEGHILPRLGVDLYVVVRPRTVQRREVFGAL